MPTEPDSKALPEQLIEASSNKLFTDTMDNAAAPAFLSKTIHQDVEVGCIMTLQGGILSEIEDCQGALSYFIFSPYE